MIVGLRKTEQKVDVVKNVDGERKFQRQKERREQRASTEGSQKYRSLKGDMNQLR